MSQSSSESRHGSGLEVGPGFCGAAVACSFCFALIVIAAETAAGRLMVWTALGLALATIAAAPIIWLLASYGFYLHRLRSR